MDIMLACTICGKQGFKSAQGRAGHMMLAHNVLSGRATEPKPELGATTEQVFSPEVIDITGEAMIEALSGQTDRIVERLIAANTEAKLGQPDHPPGFCDGEHCADVLRQHEATQRQREVEIQQATAKWIHQQYDHVARDLGMVDQWLAFQREYVELAAGNDAGPGYWIGSTRIVGGDKYPYITFSRNGDVYHSPR